jgi:mRNA-degrading endonuclease toxin of MazEF toxin-antitoxin module
VPLPATSKITGVVLSDHLKSVDWHQRTPSSPNTAPAEVIDEIRRKLAAPLGVQIG